MTLTALPEASILDGRCHRGRRVNPLASQAGGRANSVILRRAATMNKTRVFER